MRKKFKIRYHLSHFSGLDLWWNLENEEWEPLCANKARYSTCVTFNSLKEGRKQAKNLKKLIGDSDAVLTREWCKNGIRWSCDFVY